MVKEYRFSPPAVGGSSLLVIFALLVLSMFALLSLSTVQAEKRLTDASAQSAEAYYLADLRAEDIFARLRSGEIPPEVQESDGIYRYTCPISESQQLIVELACTQGQWNVLRWQAAALAQPETEETLPVWNGAAPQEENT